MAYVKQVAHPPLQPHLSQQGQSGTWPLTWPENQSICCQQLRMKLGDVISCICQSGWSCHCASVKELHVTIMETTGAGNAAKQDSQICIDWEL